MNVEKRTALILRGKIIAIFKSEESEEDRVADYVYKNFMDLGLTYRDISELELRTIYVEL